MRRELLAKRICTRDVLAHARGARRVATEALYDAEYRLKSLRDAVSSAFVEAGSFVSQKRLSPADAVRDAAILFPPIPPTLRGSRTRLLLRDFEEN